MNLLSRIDIERLASGELPKRYPTPPPLTAGKAEADREADAATLLDCRESRNQRSPYANI
jgi:hypothetical protein